MSVNGKDPHDDRDTLPPPTSPDVLDAKMDACINDVRAMRYEQREHGRILGHMFENMGEIVTRLDRIETKLGDRLIRVESGLAVVRDHTAAQWRDIEAYGKSARRSDPSIRPSARKELPSLAEVDAAIVHRLNETELATHRKRWERIIATIGALIVALLSALLTFALKR